MRFCPPRGTKNQKPVPLDRPVHRRYARTMIYTSRNLPDTFRAPTHTITPRYSKHARDEARYDKYVGAITLPYRIDLSEFKVFELETREGKVHKLGVRGHYNGDYDIAYVLVRDAKGWFVKTLWVNHKSDRPL